MLRIFVEICSIYANKMVNKVVINIINSDELSRMTTCIWALSFWDGVYTGCVISESQIHFQEETNVAMILNNNTLLIYIKETYHLRLNVDNFAMSTSHYECSIQVHCKIHSHNVYTAPYRPGSSAICTLRLTIISVFGRRSTVHN